MLTLYKNSHMSNVRRYEMSQRVTIMLDDDIVRKLRTKQAKLLQENKGAVSFSRVINETLRPCFKK